MKYENYNEAMGGSAVYGGGWTDTHTHKISVITTVE
jgi:hypothetical protein